MAQPKILPVFADGDGNLERPFKDARERVYAHLQIRTNSQAAILSVDQPRFHIGDRVYKDKGNYKAWGYVVSVFWTRDGQERIVFEFEDHIDDRVQ